MDPKHRCIVTQNGQASIEVVVVALFFLAPRFLAIVAIGKFIDVQHTADMGARYAALERTVWYDQDGADFKSINWSNYNSAGAINNEIAARLFTDRSSDRSVIKSTDQECRPHNRWGRLSMLRGWGSPPGIQPFPAISRLERSTWT